MNDIPDLSKEDLSVSIDYLMEKGLVHASFVNTHVVYRARITDKGKVYIKGNPNLENPVSKAELDILTKKNLELQSNELEYKLTIRKQETVIRMWQVVSAIIGLLSIALVFFK